MKKPGIPKNEKYRQSVLDSLRIVNSEEENVFDQLTFLASQIAGCQVSLINFIDHDRQWTKSSFRSTMKEIAREISICAHVVESGSEIIISDTHLEDDYSDNPLVTGEHDIRFYAGFPLIHEGHAVGTICVLDNEVKTLSGQQIGWLKILADQVVAQVKLRVEMNRKNDQVNLIDRLSAQVPGLIYQFQMYPDGSSCFPLATRGTREIFELEPEQLRYDASLALSRTHPDDLAKLQNSIELSAREFSVWQQEYRVILPKKGVRWLRGHSQPELLDDRSVVWHGFITDITEERKMLASFQQNGKLAALGEMAGGIAHEINNPLAIILGNLDRLRVAIKSENINQDRVDNHLTTMRNTVERIVKIIKGLKAFSRNTENEPPAEVELAEIFEDTFALVSEKFKANGVEFTYPNGEGIYLLCNAVQISQTFMNLINNAFDAIAGKDRKWIRISYDIMGTTLSIRFTDCGLGISKDVAEKIMQPFFTTKPVNQGTGLGLSVSRGLVEKHGGQLYYDSTTQNTCFVIEMPISRNSQKQIA